ncbi:unnamed protein product [Didymodactylos carnosus]|uniref:DDE-1 domain-containing protein n=1 Tax=Didymodactylos carnosus TaxID=1234261 RepID=A0A815BY13_9BILA|nr:unnamed protein product [Didymodactylos carnosus]CAF4066853.1 unnamed protein product [Didymodactylos carnosus]
MSQRKRTSYKKQDLEEAVLAYKNKEMTSVEAAKKYQQYLVALIKELEQIGVRTTKACTLKVAGEYISLVNGGGAVNTSDKLICCNAAGEVMPLFIIYAAKSLNQMWPNGGPTGNRYGVSDSGRINEYLCTTWFEHHFLPQTVGVDKPILLIMDNLPAHISVHSECSSLVERKVKQLAKNLQFVSAKQVWKRIVSKYFSKTNRSLSEKWIFLD